MTNPPWQSDLNIQMVIKLLRMTESSHDGEALNAIRMVNSLLNKHNANWDDVLHGAVPMIDADPFAKVPYVGGGTSPRGSSGPRHTDAAEIEPYFVVLSQRDLGTFKDYVDDVYKWWQEKRFLTDKQYNVIKVAAQRRPRRA
jgi:hypothetical protein